MAKKSKKGLIIWGAVSAVLMVTLVTANVLLKTQFKDIVDIALGGERANYVFYEDAPYKADYKSKAEAKSAADKLNEQVCEEGFVLLKNKNAALPIKTPVSDPSITSKPKVSVFGKNSVNPVYGGTGSSGGGSESFSLYDSLEKAGYECNPSLKSFYEDDGASGAKRSNTGSDLDSGDTVVLSTAETPREKYNATLRSSYASYADAAIVMFSRTGGEGYDLPRSMKGAAGARKEDDHYLQLDQNEADLLKEVCESSFSHVIVLLNTGGAMEATFLEDPTYYAYQEKIDAALWIGFPGDSGMEALGKILNGSVNPSGRTVDTFAKDFKKDPTWNNFGDNLITGNASAGIRGGDQYSFDGRNQLYYFVDYEEGTYVGYRYYETRGYTDGEDWYHNAVLYPFGYGLSYTNFAWTVKSSTLESASILKGKTYEVEVEVKNVGNVAGKDVVEAYASAPYEAGGIEKPYKTLVSFAKTKLLEPGASEVVRLSIDPYLFASYDYTDANHNGFKGYELEQGDYKLFLSKNAHEDLATLSFQCPGLRYEKDPVTDYAVQNRYTDQPKYFNSDEELSTVLSRGDWEGSYPTSPTDEQREVDQAFIDALKDVATNNPTDYSEMEMPWFGEEGTLKFSDMFGFDDEGKPYVDYEDSRWEELLSQCTEDELIRLCDAGGFQTAPIPSIGKAKTNETDGCAGFTNFMDKSGTYSGTCHYACETIFSSTWNEELIESLGVSLGNEGLIGATEGQGNGLPYSGLYAPATNIHRSPFGGRNFEYFSEDPLLAGKMAASEIRGCQSKGVYCFLKHFALNEQETHRSIGGNCTWVSEKAMREIFLKPFEIAVKEGKGRAIMSSFNRIGTRWTGGDYRLLTEILRHEWGFHGMVLTDFNTVDYMNTRQMAYAGGSLNLIALTGTKLWADPSDTGDMIVLTQNAKDILYTVAYSNYMNGYVDGYKMSYWSMALIGIDIGVGVLLAAWGALAFIFYFKKPKGETL